MKGKTLFFFGLIFIISMSYYFFISKMYPKFENYLYEIYEKPCQVPKLNPFDESILQFIKKPDNITCSPNGPLVDSDLDYLYVNKHLLRIYGAENNEHFQCYYQAFEREIPDTTKSDNGIVHVNERKPFFSKVKIEDEFVEVVCEYEKKQIYFDMFSFVPRKSNKNRNKHANIKQKVNILIFGIDSLSHMNFQRQMPKTKKYIDEQLNSILMFDYNKVADNTYPNLIPILTGQSDTKLLKRCRENYSSKFDKCHFIWNNYSNAGYLTAYAEDSSYWGLFNYGKLGFQEQPTHYYWRTFMYYAENTMRKEYCLGPRPIYQVILEYTKKFTTRLKDEPFFGIFWSTTLSHGCLNCPLLSDEDYVKFFDYLKRDNILNNTIVIFLSDHGIRFGDILKTRQGYMEERLPFLYFIFPSWFNTLYANAIKNMRANANRLTANYDIYETLLDLLDVDKLKTKYLVNNKEAVAGKRGISLFSLVPKNRSCEMAGIPSHFCTCTKRYEVYTYSTAVIKIANFLVSYINNLLVDHNECAQLKLESINSALVSKVLTKSKTYLKEYMITIKTIPSGAIFQSTVECTDNCYKEKSYKISGSTSRLNRYGNQSSCVSNQKLKMFCYCILQ